jgi:inner membrane protein
MMGITHTAISVTGVTLVTGSVSPLLLLLAGIGSQIPDLDTTKSWVGKAFYLLSKFLEERFPHRSITHSIFLSLTIATLTLPILFIWGWKIWCALPLGHLLSCFSDCFTKLGCQFFYPINKDIWVGGLNPRNRIETGKPAEYSILATCTVIFCITFYIITGGGGLQKWATQQIFPTSQTAVQILRRENKKAIKIRIVGTKQLDNSRVDEEFWAFDIEGSSLVVLDEQDQVLKVGQNDEIIPQRVEVKEARKPIRIRRQRIEEAEGYLWINSISPNAFITGTLEVEEAEAIEIPIPPVGKRQAISKSGSAVSLAYARKQDLKPLEEFFILSGEVLIKEL